MEKFRLDKLLSKSGFGSRTDVKKIIKSGRVTIAGVLVKSPAEKASPHEVLVDGQPIHYQEFIYLLMNKPQGVISATEDIRHKTVIDLISEAHASYSPFPVGRLDIDTEGLLLITNDGSLAHELLSPKKHVPKTYEAQIQGEVSQRDVDAFRKGLDIGQGVITLPADLEIIQSGSISKIRVTIYEGKFHQVKRMFEAVGKKVLFLKRISMGNLILPPDLPSGHYLEISRPFVQNA